MTQDSAFEDGPVEIRLHGRGGQGTVTMAALLVDAAFRSGWHALGFPSFGSERTGAPVAAFVRVDWRPIFDRSEVRHPNFIVVQDASLVEAVDVMEGLEPDGLVLVNAPAVPPGLASAPGAVAAPLTPLALQHLGAPVTSTAMLGFFAAATGLIGIDPACAAIRDRFKGETGAKNEALARAAFAAGLERGAAA